MRKFLAALVVLAPVFASADLCIHCPSCETAVLIKAPLRAGFEDDGYTWTCRVCRHSNWKQSPPLNCGNCGTQMGKG